MWNPAAPSSASRVLWTLFLVTALAVPAAAQDDGEERSEADESTEASVVYLVRHGEKTKDDPRDPTLSQAGLLRAAKLAELLADAGVDHLHSTDLLRTKRTIQPLADRLRLPIELYDPGDLKSFAEMLRSTPGRHVVSGHSNTTPELVRLLGGEPGDAIDEATEYDRLYLLVLAPDAEVTTVLLRYGQ